ncbi:hypothetical protein [Nocardioides sp.]|uniref:hypothetical protein n=1 Tax=Nocardioides sp. TaxID=35761 RepID=UPI00321B300D
MTENETIESAEFDKRRDQRSSLKAKHAQSLTKLMGTRSDLRGVHALADHLDDAVRWTA